MSRLRHSAPARLKRGVLVSVPLDGGGIVERELVQCCHCQFTAVWVPGLERGWGYCWRCHDWHCAKPDCRNGCRPHRQWLHQMSDKGRADGAVILGRVEAEPPKG